MQVNSKKFILLSWTKDIQIIKDIIANKKTISSVGESKSDYEIFNIPFNSLSCFKTE